MELQFTVNGQHHCLEVDPEDRLLDVLRNRLGLTGAKEGCGEGECGACTVIMDSKAVNSCLILAFQARGTEIVTVEGLARDGELDPLQKSFIINGAIQCGYCTPGMLMAAKALLMHNPQPSEEEIRTGLAGNLCRCTGYVNIIKAVKAVGKQNHPEERKAGLVAGGSGEETVSELIPGRHSFAYKYTAIRGLAENLLSDMFGEQISEPENGSFSDKINQAKAPGVK